MGDVGVADRTPMMIGLWSWRDVGPSVPASDKKLPGGLGFRVKRHAAVLALSVGFGCGAWGQMWAPVGAPGAGVFVAGGVQNSQYPAYADNALGVNGGVFWQPHLLAGAEVRASSYPLGARFLQTQVTGGLRVGVTPSWFGWQPFVYGGAGLSRARDLAADRKTIVGHWAACWQTSVGLDKGFGRWSVRLFEVSYRETYLPSHSVRSAEVNAGVVYRFHR